jgi:GNAT superfamily N-acetyltransferase
MNKKNGIFSAIDTFNNPITLEWEIIEGHTDKLSDKIKSLSPILAPSYAQTEVDFARNKPEEVLHDFMLKSLAPFFNKDDVHKTDWNVFQQETEKHLKGFFETFDWKKSSGEQDLHYFVIAKDTEKKSLGVIQFLIAPEFAKNNVKAALYGVIPAAQNRGLEKLLMSAVFKLVPHAERIFLHTRSTNQQAISHYENWGFARFAGKLLNWTDLEYVAEKTNELQKASEGFVENI